MLSSPARVEFHADEDGSLQDKKTQVSKEHNTVEHEVGTKIHGRLNELNPV
jgi:hypothetical protein